MTLPVVFFDAGGTLLQPRRPVGETYAAVAAAYGVRADAAVLHEGFRAAWRAMKPRDPVQGARAMDDRAWWREVVRRSWEGHALPDGFPFEAYFADVYDAFARPELWKVFPEVPDVLDALRARGIRCGVLSNWDRRLRRVLDGLGLLRHFDPVVISSEVGVEKPHPRIFALACSAAGIEPGRAVLWGDEPEFDGAASAAGWQFGHVCRPERDLTDLLGDLLKSIPD